MTFPDALAEKVVSQKELGEKTLKLHQGEQVDTSFITEVLRSYGFEYVDYVYEPGQYALRGSIIDVFLSRRNFLTVSTFLVMRWTASVRLRWIRSCLVRRKTVWLLYPI